MTAVDAVGERLRAQLSQPLLRNGYALVISSGTTALLGMAFWTVAARNFSAEVVGVNAALVAAMLLLSTLAQLNLSNALQRFVPGIAGSPLRFILSCYAVSAGAAVAVASVFLAGLQWWSPSLVFVTLDPVLAAWFVFSVVVWCLFVLQDGALSAVRRSDVVLVKNAVYGAAKLGLLLTPLMLASRYGLYLAWTLPVVPILLVGHQLLSRRLIPAHLTQHAVRDAEPVTPQIITRFVSADYVIGLAGTGTISVLPILVLERAGATEAAYFSLAWSVAYALYLVGRGMSVSLLVEGSREPERLSEFAGRILGRTAAILVPLVVAVSVGAPLLLQVFGADYATAGTPVLRLLALSMVPALVIVVYGSVERVRGRMVRLMSFTVVSNAGGLALAVLLLESAGLAGLGAGWLISQTLAALWCLLQMRDVWPTGIGLRLIGLLALVVSGARARIGSHRQQGWLAETYASVSGQLGLPPRWQVQSVFPTVGDVVVGTAGRSTPSVVVKAARTPRGSVGLRDAQAALRQLRGDPRVGDWAALLPETLAVARSAVGEVVVVEQLAPPPGPNGVKGPAAVDHRDSAASLVLATLQELHRRTGRVVTLDEAWARIWIDEPAGVIRDWLTEVDPAAGDAIDVVSARLRTAFVGTDRTVSWIHGDLTVANTALATGPLRVTHVLDWELASDQGLPEIDEILLRLSERQRTERRELGDLVVSDLTGDPERDDPRSAESDLVLLTWLHHVASVVRKTSHLQPTSWWAQRNVRQVLRCVAPVGGRTGPRTSLVPPALRRGLVFLLPIVVATLVWLTSVARVDPRQLTDLGLVSVLPWPAYVGLAVLTGGFVHQVVRVQPLARSLAAYPLVLTALVYLVPLIVYSVPRFSWAWKHVGIVDYITRHGGVDPSIETLAVYHNWPGFFAAGSMLTELTGMGSALPLAAAAEVVINVLTTAAVLALLSTLSADRRLVAVGGWLFVLANWVGQGYFSPQGVAYVWYLLILALLLRYFRTWPAPGAVPVGRHRKVAVLGAVLLLMYVVISTHQLTPAIVCLTLGGLVLVRELTPRTLPALAVVGLATWALYAAAPFTAANLAEALGAVGAVNENLDNTLIGYERVSEGQRVVSMVARALTLGFCALASLGVLATLRTGGFRRRGAHRGRPDRTALVLVVAPMATVVLSAYGSEVLFRVYLFALPGLVYFAAGLLLPAAAGRRWFTGGLLCSVTGVLIAALLVAQFGNDRRYHFTEGEVAAARYVSEVAPPHTLLVEGSRNYPSQFENYENFVYVPLTREDWSVREEMVADPVGELSRWLDSDDYAAAYLIITRSQKAEAEALGELPGTGLAGIEDALLRSDQFDAVFRNEDATVFVLVDDDPGAESSP